MQFLKMKLLNKTKKGVTFMQNIIFKAVCMLFLVVALPTTAYAQSTNMTKGDSNALIWAITIALLAAFITYLRVCRQKKKDRDEKAKLKKDIERNI